MVLLIAFGTMFIITKITISGRVTFIFNKYVALNECSLGTTCMVMSVVSLTLSTVSATSVYTIPSSPGKKGIDL